MKFSISKNRLLGVLLHLKNAVPSWKTVNGSAAGYVWRSFIFEAKNDNLVIQATDSEILMKEEMSLLEPVEENKTFAVDATQLIKAIKTLDDQPLDFEVLEYQVIVHHETGHFALPLAQGIECYFDGKGIGVDFNQALDARLVTDEIAALLAKVHWIRYVRFGCDTTAQIAHVEKAASLMNKHGYKGEYFLYCILMDFQESYSRVNHWRGEEYKRFKPYAQPYRPLDKRGGRTKYRFGSKI